MANKIKKPDNAGLQYIKTKLNSDYKKTVEEIQEFRENLPKFIQELDIPITVKIDVLEEIIDFVQDQQMKLFATNLQSAYIAWLASIRFGGYTNE